MLYSQEQKDAFAKVGIDTLNIYGKEKSNDEIFEEILKKWKEFDTYKSNHNKFIKRILDHITKIIHKL